MKAQNNCLGGRGCVFLPTAYQPLNRPWNSKATTTTVEPDLYYPGTSIVQTAQIGHVACSLLTIMKFGLDESTRREPKGCCLPVWWLVYSTIN